MLPPGIETQVSLLPRCRTAPAGDGTGHIIMLYILGWNSWEGVGDGESLMSVLLEGEQKFIKNSQLLKERGEVTSAGSEQIILQQ